MYPIFVKEFRQFFSSLTGYLAIGLFLLLMGLFLFVFPNTSLLDYGYATLDKFFELAPWVLLLLAPAITMRSFADEFKSGTWELLKTRPLTLGQIIGGKFWGAFAVAVLALIPTGLYVITIKWLSINGSIDGGGIAGAYVGLLCLTAVFTAVGICCSALSANAIVAFLMATFGCFILYEGFSALSQMAGLSGQTAYWVDMLGIKYHYLSLSRGVLELSHIAYFAILIALFLLLTRRWVYNR
ncbi:MAG TPA: gliding motility-associated ABC transporter permease subunit GldF [Phnomibacter sp.]|nr:gliding motility-associated ABC transporter permease subunit GldF [Phnomibacter sp.]